MAFATATGALLGAAGIGAAGSLATGLISNSGQRAAAEATERAANRSADMQMQMHQQNRTDLAPWRFAGLNALNLLSRGMTGMSLNPGGVNNGMVPMPGFGTGAPGYGAGGGVPLQYGGKEAGGTGGGSPYDQPYQYADAGSVAGNRNAFLNMFQSSPDYQFRLNEGLRGVERSAAARGMLGSGATLRALNDYAQNTASAEYGNWYNRLASLAGVGQSATTTGAQLGASAAAGAGNAIAQGGMAAGQQRASGYNALASGIGAGTNNLLFANFMGQRGYGGGGGGSFSPYTSAAGPLVINSYGA